LGVNFSDKLVKLDSQPQIGHNLRLFRETVVLKNCLTARGQFFR
jgi:hypothetical protein